MRERAVLVGSTARGVETRTANGGRKNGQRTRRAVEESLEELSLLADSAGAAVVGQVVQTHGSVDPSVFVSKGKLDEIGDALTQSEGNLVIFDDDLSAGQSRNLAEKLRVKVIDRTELILDIFARRARTREARLAVELAQLEYLLPRLTRLWVHLSRTGGGIGTRGPGETQLEVDRRQVRTRIGTLKRGLQAVERERGVQRAGRRDLFRVALVGYTNAGKSTLFNALTRATVTADARLFATLDPTTRRLRPPASATILVSDTVGFIRKLPHHLVASFRATFAEVREADLLLHVVDATQPAAEEQIAAVQAVLSEIDALRVPTLIVLNKADAVWDETHLMGLEAGHPECITVSALTGQGMDALWSALVTSEATWRAARSVRAHTSADVIALPSDQSHEQQAYFTGEGYAS
jgi:GTP-binding protein HflX